MYVSAVPSSRRVVPRPRSLRGATALCSAAVSSPWCYCLVLCRSLRSAVLALRDIAVSHARGVPCYCCAVRCSLRPMVLAWCAILQSPLLGAAATWPAAVSSLWWCRVGYWSLTVLGYCFILSSILPSFVNMYSVVWVFYPFFFACFLGFWCASTTCFFSLLPPAPGASVLLQFQACGSSVV